MKLSLRTLFSGITTKSDFVHLVNNGLSYKAELKKLTEAFEYDSIAYVDAVNGSNTTGRAGNVLLPFKTISAARASLAAKTKACIIIMSGEYNEGAEFNYATAGKTVVYYAFPNVVINVTTNEPFLFETGFSNSRVEFYGYADISIPEGSMYFCRSGVTGCSIYLECNKVTTGSTKACINPQGGKFVAEFKIKEWYLQGTMLGGTTTNNGHVHRFYQTKLIANGAATFGSFLKDSNPGSLMYFKDCTFDYTGSNYNAGYVDEMVDAKYYFDHCTIITNNKSIYNGLATNKPFFRKCEFIIKSISAPKYVFNADETGVKMIGDSYTNTATIKNGGAALYSATSYGEIRTGTDFEGVSDFLI